MPIEAGATCVFDKGYQDYGFWARLDASGCRFVTRLKKSAATTLVRESPIDGAPLLFDRIVSLSERLSTQRVNPYRKPVRLVGVRIDTGAELVLVTNDLTAPAAEIASLYKARWQVELFFKWIKQNLKIARFLGTSRNAVTIQLMAPLIAFLLMRSAIERNAATVGLKALASILPATALARRPLQTVLKPPPQPDRKTTLTPQAAFVFA
jgi:IS4 transposase